VPKPVVPVLATALLVGIGLGGWLYFRERQDSQASVTPPPEVVSYSTASLKIDSGTFTLDIADTPAKKELGLGKRASLAADRGMVFTYGRPGQQCFWMKGMRFAIDILWLDRQKKVSHIEKSLSPNTYPETYCPDVEAQYVLEIPAGASDKAGIKVGDILPLEL
jgi:uncharacterized membrane protein (UPF0127 family)